MMRSRLGCSMAGARARVLTTPVGFIEAFCYLRKNVLDRYHGMTLINENDTNVPGWKKSELFLKKNDSYTFFKKLNSLIHTGPTLTNVNDYRVVMKI